MTISWTVSVVTNLHHEASTSNSKWKQIKNSQLIEIISFIKKTNPVGGVDLEKKDM